MTLSWRCMPHPPMDLRLQLPLCRGLSPPKPPWLAAEPQVELDEELQAARVEAEFWGEGGPGIPQELSFQALAATEKNAVGSGHPGRHPIIDGYLVAAWNPKEEAGGRGSLRHFAVASRCYSMQGRWLGGQASPCVSTGHAAARGRQAVDSGACMAPHCRRRLIVCGGVAVRVVGEGRGATIFAPRWTRSVGLAPASKGRVGKPKRSACWPWLNRS